MRCNSLVGALWHHENACKCINYWSLHVWFTRINTLDSFNLGQSPPGEYGHVVPSPHDPVIMQDSIGAAVPPTLPPHLLNGILNQETDQVPLSTQPHFSICNICAVLRDLLPFVWFKNGEKHPWRSVTFSNTLKVTLLHGYFSCFLNCTNGTKLCKASHLVPFFFGDQVLKVTLCHIHYIHYLCDSVPFHHSYFIKYKEVCNFFIISCSSCKCGFWKMLVVYSTSQIRNNIYSWYSYFLGGSNSFTGSKPRCIESFICPFYQGKFSLLFINFDTVNGYSRWCFSVSIKNDK